MTNRIPEYLKLHIEESAEADALLDNNVDGLIRFCRTFEKVTGWRLSLGEPQSQLNRDQLPSTLGISPGEADDQAPPLEQARASRLATACGDLLRQLQRTRIELQRREAELAAGVPVRRRRNEEQHLAIRLEAVLKGGAEAVGCHAAALFSLDDATTHLKLRASWGLPVDRMIQPPRPLRGAVADLEALIGHAVVLEDTSLLPHWRAPEEFASAVCVPVSSPTEPLGTLWMFCDHVRPFTDQQTNLIEIIAGRVSSELQREVLLKECVSSKQLDQQLARAAEWQQSRLPNIKPLLDNWELAGATHNTQLLGAGYYDWFVANDGSLALSVGRGEGSMLESALTIAACQSFLRSHAEYTRDPARLLALTNESFWNSSAGGQFASLFHASIGPDDGELRCAAAGNVLVHLVDAGGARRLTIPSAPIGGELTIPPELHTDQMNAGEVLVALCPGDANGADTTPDCYPYLALVRRLIDQPAEELLAAVRASLSSQTADRPAADWSIIIAKRT